MYDDKLENVLARQAADLGLGDTIKQYMLETSVKPNKKPRKMFHATSVKNLSGILEKGIVPHDVYGNSYFCGTQKQCLRFVPKPCVIFEVYVDRLNEDMLFLSQDHNKMVYPFDCFTYFETVPPELIKDWKVFR